MSSIAPSENGLIQALQIARLGTVVVSTFAVVWAPYLTSWEAVSTVLQRLAPVNRGLFEDYVANFWCASSLAIKWKRVFSQQVSPPPPPPRHPGILYKVQRRVSLGGQTGLSLAL